MSEVNDTKYIGNKFRGNEIQNKLKPVWFKDIWDGWVYKENSTW